ncbi:uncharacterized protein PAC_17594 [Phialocephala subalpina]|uniref:Uncharacterized protein n=1 Tax=Phialocephala subalpina TaxID=576137 RepID=A0A1L7XRR1_9HELO|nr:uncharacterized protein PAC_17594 [Phialocephala subalpina]
MFNMLTVPSEKLPPVLNRKKCHLQALIEGFAIDAFYCSGTAVNPRSLRGFFILAAMKNQEKSVIKYLLENTAEFSSTSTDTSSFTDILSLSCYVAKMFLETSLVPSILLGSQFGWRTIPDRKKSVDIHNAESIEGAKICWRYRIIKAPAYCIQGSWIDIFIEEGLDFHGFDESSRSPLHSAAATGDLCTLKALIMAGVNVDTYTKGGVTAISQAVLNGRHEAIQFLHDAGADLTLGGSYLRFFDCALAPESMARFCTTLQRFQINEPCGNSLGELRHWETPIKVSISDYKPMPWLIRMLCDAGAELNDVGIATYLPQSEYEATFRREPDRRYNPHQTVLDRALERVEEAKSKKVAEISEKDFLEFKKYNLSMKEAFKANEEDMNKYKDRQSYNQWLYQVKEYEVWEAEEVVRILTEFGAKFGAKLGEELPGYRQSDPQPVAGIKRRRF